MGFAGEEGMSEEVWYFAYGSNLDKKNFEKRVGGFKEVRKAILKDFIIAFNSFHPGWGGGVADIVESEGGRVYGAVYKIDKEGLLRLDRAVGVPEFYRRMVVEVETDAGKVEAYTYTTVKKRGFVMPTSSYLAFILRGLKQHGWDEEVIEEVRRIARRA